MKKIKSGVVYVKSPMNKIEAYEKMNEECNYNILFISPTACIEDPDMNFGDVIISDRDNLKIANIVCMKNSVIISEALSVGFLNILKEMDYENLYINGDFDKVTAASVGLKIKYILLSNNIDSKVMVEVDDRAFSLWDLQDKDKKSEKKNKKKKGKNKKK